MKHTNKQKNIINIRLRKSYRNLAEEFKSSISNLIRANQVYLNTLAICAVQQWLKDIGIATDWTECDSNNFMIREIKDIADLEIVGVGKLECRPILSGETRVHLPPEVIHNRIGYILVEVDTKNWEAKLLGFYPSSQSESISVEQLQPLKSVINIIYPPKQKEVPHDVLAWIETTLNKMCDSVEAIFKDNSNSQRMIPLLGYRTVESSRIGYQGIINEINIVASSSIKVTKILGINKDSKFINIIFDVTSTDANICIPKGLEVQALNQDNEVISTLKAGDNHSNLRLKFRCEFAEPFTVKPFTVKLVLPSGKEIETFEYR